MELRHLQALVAVSEHGSFSAAADALGTVQSNVSAHVARLEREVGAQLVDRSAGHLTPEGEVVVARAYRVVGELEALQADLAALGEEVTGFVRAGMIGTTARWLVPPLLAELSERHRKLRLMVAEGTTTMLEPQLAAGRLDLAIVSMPVAGRDLTFEPLFEEDLVLVVPMENDPLGGAGRVELAELGRLELLLPAPGTPFRSEIDAAVKPAGVTLHPRAEMDGVRLIATLTFEGYGPAVLPASAVPPHLRPKFRLVAVDGLPNRRVGLALRSRGLPSAATRAVLDVLRRLVTSPDGLPEGLRALGPTALSRSEGSWRAVGVPND
ncbi:MAG TPA: LysR family transcriptional regulator [Acidimicrobiales bacterium]|nr:LysR family transcriptional regulator [Acidimicrobiales bacterium]